MAEGHDGGECLQPDDHADLLRRSARREYWRLINGVSQWDVGVERQVQLQGPRCRAAGADPGAARSVDLQGGAGQIRASVQPRGTIINDPILLKLADDLYWLSIADSDIWFWAGAIAAERGLDVEVSDPDVSPMALQGPKAEDVVAHVLGDWVRELKYFWFRETEIAGDSGRRAAVGLVKAGRVRDLSEGRPPRAPSCGTSSRRPGSPGASAPARRRRRSGSKAGWSRSAAIPMTRPIRSRCGWANMWIWTCRMIWWASGAAPDPCRRA